MEESADLRQVSRVDERSVDDDTVERESTSAAAAATDDVTVVISRCEYPDVWERMSYDPDHRSDVDDGEDDVTELTTGDGERRERQQHQLAGVEEMLQAAVDQVDDTGDWERFFSARDELIRLLEAGILGNVEHAAAIDAAERLSDLWTEVLETQPRGVPEECNVCLEVLKLDRRPCCRLPVCQGCMRKYVKSHLETTGVVRIGCPNADCDRFVFHEEVRELLRSSPQLRERYDRWLVDANADPRWKTCPRCCRITEMQSARQQQQQQQGRSAGRRSERRADKYGEMVDCADCRFIWCFTCQSPWHEGLTCAQNRAGDELLKTWARQRIRDEHNAQRCPRCKVYIQRISGCDHMKCTRCKTKFCYRCGGRRFKMKLFGYRLEDHDKKYSIIGCNDRFHEGQRVRRVLTRGSIFGAKVVGSLLAVPVACGAAGVALAAVTVGAPIYGVYRLVRHILRASGKFTTDDSDVSTDVYLDDAYELRWVDDSDADAESDVQRYSRRRRERLPTRDEPRRLRRSSSSSLSSQHSSASSTFDDQDEPPALPPRQPALHHNSVYAFPRRPPPSPPPPPLPPKQSRIYYNYTRRRPPSPPVDNDMVSIDMFTRFPPVHRIRATVETSRMSVYPPPLSASLDVQSQDVHVVGDLELVVDDDDDDALSSPPPATRQHTTSARRRPPAVPPPSPRHDDPTSSNVDSTVAETVSDEITHL